MSTQRKRFPTTDPLFHAYVGNAVPYLATHATRLTLAPARITALNALKAAWDTAFATAQDPNLSTKTARDEKTALRRQLMEALRAAYADIPESLLTIADRNTLNLPERDRTPTPRAAITTAPGTLLHPRAGSAMVVECRVAADSSRPSRHPLCDTIEYRYALAALRPATGGGGGGGTGPDPGPGPTPPPPAASPGSAIGFSTRAKFTLRLTEEDAGRIITLQARWVNLTDPDKSGPWGNPVSAMVTW